MTKTIASESLSKEIIDILEETFETHHGVYLDEGTTLFETLDLWGPQDSALIMLKPVTPA